VSNTGTISAAQAITVAGAITTTSSLDVDGVATFSNTVTLDKNGGQTLQATGDSVLTVSGANGISVTTPAADVDINGQVNIDLLADTGDVTLTSDAANVLITASGNAKVINIAHDADAATGVINIGRVSTNAVNVGLSGKLTNVKGDLTVDEDLTVTLTALFSSTSSFANDITMSEAGPTAINHNHASQFTLSSSGDILLDSASGASVKIGSATDRKVGFYGSAGVVRAGAISNSGGDDATAVNAILTALRNLNLIAT